MLRRSKCLFANPKCKWIVLALAFVIGLQFNSETKSDTAKANDIIITVVPEPPAISLIVCGGVALLFFARKKQKHQ